MIYYYQDAKTTPCVKYALGVLVGKYDNMDIFTGLVEAMVCKTDRKE
jgi:hypothetical protein